MARSGNGITVMLVMEHGEPRAALTMYINGVDQTHVYYNLSQLDSLISVLSLKRDELEKYLMDRGSVPPIPGV